MLAHLGELLDKSRTQVVADNYAGMASFYLPACAKFEQEGEGGFGTQGGSEGNLLIRSKAMMRLLEETLNTATKPDRAERSDLLSLYLVA